MTREVDDERIQHLASLARLELSPGEQEVLHRQLGEILAYMARIRDLDPERPSPPAPEEALPPREDLVVPSLDRDLLLRDAPRTDEGFIQVPRILEEDPDEV